MMPKWQHTLTVDASVSVDGQVVGIGIVVQQRIADRGRGTVLERIAETHAGISTPSAEEFAVLRALEVASEKGISHLKIRSDYNQLRRALRDQHRRRTRCAGDELRSSILRLARTFEWVDFGWIPRRKNQMAHALARQARAAARTGSKQRPAGDQDEGR